MLETFVNSTILLHSLIIDIPSNINMKLLEVSIIVIISLKQSLTEK